MYDRLTKTVEYIKSKCALKPELAIVLGSGLNEIERLVTKCVEISYSELTDFPQSTVKGHLGKFKIGYINDTPIIMACGRVHFYEGYSPSEVVMPIRIMHMLGAKTLLLTNASGGINSDFNVGDIMLIKDHICLATNPLIGQNIDELGTRFPDMSNAYDIDLRNIMKTIAKRYEINLHEGVYVQFTGPSFETSSEVNMARIMGGDAVGMSTAIETIAAKHMSMKVVGISYISNQAAGISKTPLTHEEVLKGSKIATGNIVALIKHFIK